MRFRYFSMLSAALVLSLGSITAQAKEVVPMPVSYTHLTLPTIYSV